MSLGDGVLRLGPEAMRGRVAPDQLALNSLSTPNMNDVDPELLNLSEQPSVVVRETMHAQVQ